MAQRTYHVLYIDPTLGVDWFYVTARAYWLKYEPIVTADFDLVSMFPHKVTVVLTTLARRDFASKLANTIQTRFPHVLHDPLVYDYPAEMQLTLDGRVHYFQRFGLPDDGIPTRPLAQP